MPGGLNLVLVALTPDSCDWPACGRKKHARALQPEVFLDELFGFHGAYRGLTVISLTSVSSLNDAAFATYHGWALLGSEAEAMALADFAARAVVRAVP